MLSSLLVPVYDVYCTLLSRHVGDKQIVDVVYCTFSRHEMNMCSSLPVRCILYFDEHRHSSLLVYDVYCTIDEQCSLLVYDVYFTFDEYIVLCCCTDVYCTL